MLQRRRRIAARREPLRGQHRARSLIRLDQSIRRVPARPVAPRVTAQRLRQIRIGLDQIPPRPARVRRVGRIHGKGAPQCGQIELRIVDGFHGVGWRGPIQARWRAPPCFLFKRAQIRQPSMRRAHDFQRIKRRHPRPRFHCVHPRIGEHQPRAGRRASDMQPPPFVGNPVVLHAQTGVQGLAVIVQ